MGRDSPPFFLEVNGWVQLRGIVAIPVIVCVQTFMLLRLECFYTTCTCTCTLYITYNILYTNNKQSQVVSFLQQATHDQNLVNLRDRENLRTKDNINRPVPKVSFVQRLDCIFMIQCSCSQYD